MDTETDLVASHFMECEKKYGSKFKKFISNYMSPALLSNNIDNVIALGWKMNSMSNMRVLEGIYNTDILRELNDVMFSEGALYAGISSAGPGFFAFADSEAKAYELSNVLETRFNEYFSKFLIGRAGTKLGLTFKNDMNSIIEMSNVLNPQVIHLAGRKQLSVEKIAELRTHIPSHWCPVNLNRLVIPAKAG